jgi:hypothetical protein
LENPGVIEVLLPDQEPAARHEEFLLKLDQQLLRLWSPRSGPTASSVLNIIRLLTAKSLLQIGQLLLPADTLRPRSACLATDMAASNGNAAASIIGIRSIGVATVIA